MADESKLLDDALNPADIAQLREYQTGTISARELARRVLARLGIDVPETLKGERVVAPDEDDAAAQNAAATSGENSSATATQDGEEEFTSSMGEDTAMIARGELDIAGWLSRAEDKYRSN